MFIRIAPALLAAFLAAAPPVQDPAAQKAPESDKDPFRVHIRMHRKIAPKVVQVQAAGQVGTGVIIRSDGLILTSPSACGPRTSTANVTLSGNRRMKGDVIGRRNDLELVLLKVDAKDLPAMEFADSTKARIGQVTYAFGDVWGSITIDDQVAMSLGIVSGLYEVATTQERSSLYTGPVIETSAAVNQNLDGGPLVDAEGKMLGMITLNYHPAKFTGIAIPSHILKPEVEVMIKEFTDGGLAKEPGFVGIRVEEAPGSRTGVVIVSVSRGSPAEKAGLREGDQILRIDTDRVTSLEKFDELTQYIRASTRIRFQVAREGKNLPPILVVAGARPERERKPEY